MSDIINIGDIVRSNAGRDKGKLFVVVNFYSEEILLLANGNMRKVEKPKKKKIKHISKVASKTKALCDKINSSEKITNPFIRKELMKFNKEI